MARNTTSGYWRQHGAGRKGDGASPGSTPAVVPSVLLIPEFATTTAAGTGQPTGKVLPKGARVLEVIFNGAATGGSSPTFDIGYAGALDAFVDGGDADGGLGREVVFGAALSANTEVLVGNGGAVSTGGTVEAAIVYVMDDDGSLND